LQLGVVALHNSGILQFTESGADSIKYATSHVHSTFFCIFDFSLLTKPKEFGLLTKGYAGKRDVGNAMRKLQVVLKAILLRRSKTSLIDGKPIIILPEKTEEI
jgi:hypothetical protein